MVLPILQILCHVHGSYVKICVCVCVCVCVEDITSFETGGYHFTEIRFFTDGSRAEVSRS